MSTIRTYDTYGTELLFKITIKGTIRNPKESIGYLKDD